MMNMLSAFLGRSKILKEWIVIHQIKALYDEGRGSSKKAIAKQLKVSINTVRKYLEMEVTEIEKTQSDSSKMKLLDVHQEYIEHLLVTFPLLSAVKVKRKLEAKVGALEVSHRSFRRYISAIKKNLCVAQPRYYEPVLDDVPGVQCQVDPGELRDVLIEGIKTTVYFVVFVLSFSRLMYVGTSRRPIDTETFIRLHDAAFRYFGGHPEECVYDQIRLVVIDEQYRELTLNQRFAQYATAAEFRIRACEGYDPERKGKVEAGVKYVKQDALYGESFTDWSEMNHHLQQWLDKVANQRVHGTTGLVPRQHYDEQELSKMRAYLTPESLSQTSLPGEPRKVDKTGLISFKSNKYSVPMLWQRGQVNVLATVDGQLLIYDRQQGQCIATHPLNQGKGAIIKNGDHYRDKQAASEEMEKHIAAVLGDELSNRLCQQLHRTDPQQYRDKLRGVKRHLSRLQELPRELLLTWADKEGLNITRLLEYLTAWEAHPERFREYLESDMEPESPSQNKTSLAGYAELTERQGGLIHVVH